MGAVQRLATVVIVGLVALSTILVLYLADEANRGRARAELLQDAAIKRGQASYIAQCLLCHGPGGEGFLAPGELGTGRTGAPLNLQMYRTGVNEQGTPVARFEGSAEVAATVIANVIKEGIPDDRGGYRMPPFGENYAGPLNDTQVEELVIFIQNADWNAVFNAAVEYAGGYPTAPPAPAAPAAETPEPAEEPVNDVPAAAVFDVEMVDIAFTQTELIVPANTEITINLVNNGVAVHNFNIDELGVNSGDFTAGQTGSVTFNTGAPGEYEYYCSIPGHRQAGQVGRLIVVEGAVATPVPAAETPEPAEEPVNDVPAAAVFDVEMVDIAFTQTELIVPANTEITINLVNNGFATHNFNIDELGVHSGDFTAGQTGSVTFNTGAPGEYEYYCSIPGHRQAGQVGTLIVQ